MAKKIINIGKSQNKGDGDPLRTAFSKVNDNFDELYSGSFTDTTDFTTSIIPRTDNEISLGSSTKRWSELYVKDFIFINGVRLSGSASGDLVVGGNIVQAKDIVGSIFADDSTLMMDGLTGKHYGPLIGDVTGSVFADNSTLLIDGVAGNIPSANISGTEATNWNTAYGWGDHSTQNYIVDGTADAITATMVAEDVITSRELADGNSYNGTFDGDITGSVFGDDSTLLVDGNNNKIVGPVDTASLRTSEDKIALGNAAGGLNQSQYGIGIGFGAGAGNQEDKAISIGHRAGQVSQGASAVAIGNFAGNTVQGQNAVALGSQAGENNQASNSVVINATGSVLENTTASSLVIKPIRNATMTTILGYDATSGEVTHNAAIPGYISLADLKTEVAASADFADFQTRIAAL